jgi:hypothetical protein
MRFLLEITDKSESITRLADAQILGSSADVPIDPIFGHLYAADPALVAERHANLQRWQSEFDAATFSGPFKVWELTETDMAYIASVQERYKLQTGRDIMRDGLFEGKHADLNAARNHGEHVLNNVDLTAYSSALKDEVERRLA